MESSAHNVLIASFSQSEREININIYYSIQPFQSHHERHMTQTTVARVTVAFGVFSSLLG